YVDALATDGTNLYVGGNFTNAGGIANTFCIAKWNGSAWSALGSSGLNSTVRTIAMINSTTFYAGGVFSNIGGDPNKSRIVKWNGSDWEAVGAGLNSDVTSIAISGADVYVGGLFTNVGDVVGANYIAHWNGSTWSALGSPSEAVSSVAVVGTEIFVAGNSNISNDAANPSGVAKWNGSSWESFGNFNSTVSALLASGGDLYIGSPLTGSSSPIVWNGSTFSFFGSGLAQSVNTIAVSGENIFIGGGFTNAFQNSNINYIAMRNGAVWSSLGSGLNGSVKSIAVSGSDVYVGGQFTDAGGITTADHIARWNGSAWSAMGNINPGVQILSMAITGSTVYAGGVFTDLSGVSGASGIAKWNGATWEALGDGLFGGEGEAYITSIVISGSDVFVGGYFQNAGGISDADNIARWDGSTWHAVGNGLNEGVSCMVMNDGLLYVGGEFSDVVGGVSNNLNRLAVWNGSAWQPLGSGLGNEDYVYSLACIGSEVYAGGNFEEIGSTAATNIAKWNGIAWESVASGLNNTVNQMAVSSNDLIVGGEFTKSGTEVANKLAVYHAPTPANPLVVTNNSDDNVVGTLRYATNYANAHPGLDTIRFDASMIGQKILTEGITIPDETLVNGDINGDRAPDIAIQLINTVSDYALQIGNQVTIHAINISGSKNGIRITGSQNTISNSYFGTNLSGSDTTGGFANQFTAIYGESAASFITIEGNLLAGRKDINGVTGLLLNGGRGHLIRGNVFGTDKNGNLDLGFKNSSVVIDAKAFSFGDGSFSGRNIVVNNGNGGTTVYLGGDSVRVLGNFVGLWKDGVTAKSNGSGMSVVGNCAQIGDGSNSGRNVIGNCANAALVIQGNYGRVLGNYIGTDSTGIVARGNTQGVYVGSGSHSVYIGDGTADGRNIICSNNIGIYSDPAGTDSVYVLGNWIGIGADGVTLLTNKLYGILFNAHSHHNMIGDGTIGGRNVISGNNDGSARAMLVSSRHNRILGNYIGVLPDGMTLAFNNDGIWLENDSNHIGDGTAGGRNIISGNSNGIVITSKARNNKILGNYIGIASDGAASVPNVRGIFSLSSTHLQIGDGTSGGRNIISGNTQVGIRLTSTDSALVFGNYIGVGSDALTPMANSIGLQLDNASFSNRIADNIIANSSQYGIQTSDATTLKNTFFKNRIYKTTIQPISQVSGAQESVWPPAIFANGGNVYTGLASKGALVQFFADSSDEGLMFLDTVFADPSTGKWSKTLIVPSGMNLTAMQDSAGNSSVFSTAYEPIRNVAPSIPVLLTPQSNALTNNLRPTFTWHKSIDGDDDDVFYQILVSKNSDLSDAQLTVSNITDTTFTSGTDLDSTFGYYWRIIAVDNKGGAAQSAVRFFKTDAKKPKLTASLHVMKAIERYVQVYIASDETLVSRTVSFSFSGNTIQKTPDLIADGLYQVNYEIATSEGLLSVIIQGGDSAGNVQSSSLSYQVTSLNKKSGVSISHQMLTLDVPPNATSGDGLLMVTSFKSDQNIHKVNSVDLVPVSDTYELISAVSIMRPWNLTIRFNELESSEWDERKVSLYAQRDGQWVYVGGEG
ncbi:MAG TPA: hypothetical protein PKJ64_05845, partial [bacterium]|nr:hypothetical protein [bacterium]